MSRTLLFSIASPLLELELQLYVVQFPLFLLPIKLLINKSKNSSEKVS